MSTTTTVRLDDDVRNRLGRLADATHRSKSFLAANEWQIAELQAALKEADAGGYASDEDVAALGAKWQGKAGQGG